MDIQTNYDEGAMQAIWQNLQPVGGAVPESKPDQEDEPEDNGERVVVAHLKIFLAAILGFNIGRLAPVSNPDPNLTGTIDDQSGDYMLSKLEV